MVVFIVSFKNKSMNKVNLTLEKYTELVETIQAHEETIKALETIISEEVRNKGYLIKLDGEYYTTDEIIIKQQEIIKQLKNEIKEINNKSFWSKLF